jgi:hypothetical protein
MSIKGKFFPVGHGLTYGFKINDFNLLFDITKKRNLLNDVERFFGSTHIDTLILSHFHDDHVDGVNNLISSGFDIDRVFIPYIDDDERFIVRLKRYFRSRTKSISIFTEDDNFRKDDRFTIIEVHEELKIEAHSISSDFWEFNVVQSKGNANSIISAILGKLAGIGIHTKDDVLAKLSTNFDDIKKAYDSSIGDLNLTSIYLIHGPLDCSSITDCTYGGQQFLPFSLNMGFAYKYHSLITGDCNLDRNRSKISSYSDQLGFALVPHHSGLKEWSDYLCVSNLDLLWIVTISKVGSRPNGLVVRDIYVNSNELFICDKNHSFEYDFHI